MIKRWKQIKINPILQKELTVGSRSFKLPLAVMLYDIALAFVAVIVVFFINTAINEDFGMNFNAYMSIYQVIGWLQLAIMMLIAPILTAGSIAGEREKQTLEIMLTTPKKPMSIVWGKLMASLSNYMIFLISSIPIMALAFILGGLNWFALLGYLFMMVWMGVYIGSIGLYCSSAFKKTISAIVMTFLLVALLLVGTILVFIGIVLVIAVIYEIVDSNMGYTLPDLNCGLLPMLLIGNPLTGFLDYMLRSMDVASLSDLLEELDAFGVLMPIVAKAWIPMNLVVSGGISYLFLRKAAKKLDPIRNKKKKKKAVQNAVVKPVPESYAVMQPVMQPVPQPVQETQPVPTPTAENPTTERLTTKPPEGQDTGKVSG